jgi:hypothetical protein
MDTAPPRGKLRGRALVGRARGGGRGRAGRARGRNTHEMRVPPEYLPRVIAWCQGLDPDGEEQGRGGYDEGDEDEDEDEEAAERERRYRPCQLGTTADRYREPEPEGEVLEGDEEDEQASTCVFRE